MKRKVAALESRARVIAEVEELSRRIDAILQTKPAMARLETVKNVRRLQKEITLKVALLPDADLLACKYDMQRLYLYLA